MTQQATYHALDRVLDLADGELQDDVDSLVFGVLLLDTFEHAVRLFAVAALSASSIASTTSPFGSFFAVLLNHPQADDFIAVVNEFVDQPFQSSIGVIVYIGAAEEGTRTLGVLIFAMLATQSQREVRGVAIVESVKRDTGFELTGLCVSRGHVEDSMSGSCAHVGGGGLLSRLAAEFSLMGTGLRLRLRLVSVAAAPATRTLGMNWTEVLRAGLLSSELWKRMGKGRGLSPTAL
jgi:hypothetical protein